VAPFFQKENKKINKEKFNQNGGGNSQDWRLTFPQFSQSIRQTRN